MSEQRRVEWGAIDASWFASEVECRFEILGIEDAEEEVKVRMAKEILDLYRAIVTALSMRRESTAEVKRDACTDIAHLLDVGRLRTPPSLKSLFSHIPEHTEDASLLNVLPKIITDDEELRGRPDAEVSSMRASTDFMRRPEDMQDYLAHLLTGK